MIRAKPELLYGGVTMAPQDAAWDFDAIMPALRDPDRRVSPLKEVEKWSSSHADTILEVAAQGQIEKAWTQIVDALHQMARAQFQRTSTVLAEIKDATVRRREALRHRQSCREALALDGLIAGLGMDNLGCAQTETSRPNMFVDLYRQKQHHSGPNYAVNYKKHGRDGTTH